MALFVTELAFGEEQLGTDARLGVVVASIVAAILGTIICVPGKLEPDMSMADITGTSDDDRDVATAA